MFFILRSLARIWRFPPLSLLLCVQSSALAGLSWVSLNSILYQTINTSYTLLSSSSTSSHSTQFYLVTTESYKPTPAGSLIPPPPPPQPTILNINSSKFFTLFFFTVLRWQSLNINWLCNHQINVRVNKVYTTHLQGKRKLLMCKIPQYFDWNVWCGVCVH